MRENTDSATLPLQPTLCSKVGLHLYRSVTRAAPICGFFNRAAGCLSVAAAAAAYCLISSALCLCFGISFLAKLQTKITDKINCNIS